MRNDPYKVAKHTGKVVLIPKVGNGTVTSFSLKDTTTYQIGPHGDYVQEQGG